MKQIIPRPTAVHGAVLAVALSASALAGSDPIRHSDSGMTIAGGATPFLCAAYNTLNGPIGWGLGLLMIAFGAVMMMTGNKTANGIIITAIVGGVVLAASGTLLGLVLGDQRTTCVAGNSL